MANFNKHIVIVGTARSGTSWLSETIARQHRYRMLFEPEHETRTKRGYLICDQWIETRSEAEEAYRYLRQVFQNRVDCDWIAQNSNRKYKRHLLPFIPKMFVIKFVRANLSAQFINETFHIPVVHIIRNPYDVIRSQQQVSFPWLFDLSIFSKQDKLVDKIMETFNYDIRRYSNLNPIEQLTLRWCIENVLPLEVLGGYTRQSKIIKYEDLSRDLNVFLELCHQFSLEPISNVKEFYRTPSSKTHPDSQIITQKNKAKNTFSVSERKAINNLLDIFETELYPRE
ncbi:sulfotransferase domain-containing protein [Psychroserpens sp. XS_ASV72]|uniref:sulfotransferase domain-containing protein n=1 Tax=Psychroserpens sp. XS_ASV72 TaxID=3241293 RepID=UPI0035181E37